MSARTRTTLRDDEFADEEGPGELEALEDEVSPEDVSVPVRQSQARSCSLCPRRLDGLRLAPACDESPFRLVVRRGLYNHGTLVQSAGSLAPLAGSQELRPFPARDEPARRRAR